MSSRFSIKATFKAIDRFTAPVRGMQTAVGKATASMTRNLRRVANVTSKVTRGLGKAAKMALKLGAVSFGAVGAAAGFMVREFSKIENAEAAFTPLLRGAERAKEMVKSLNVAAAATPFRFNTLAKEAQRLLPVMNSDIGLTIDTLKMLGDTAGGNAQRLESISRGFTKAFLKGKVDMESLNMVAEAGVPIFTELAASMNRKVGPAFFKMISTGRIATTELKKAFEKMTGKDGIFFRGMEIASKTLSGRFSTLKDNVSLTAASIGGVMAPAVKKLLVELTGVAKQVKTWVEANKAMIATKFDAFVEQARRVVSNLIASLKKLNSEQSIFDRVIQFFKLLGSALVFIQTHGAAIAKLILWLGGLTLALNTLVGVLTVVNLLMALNPVVAVVLGVIALSAAITFLITNFKTVISVLKTFFNFLGDVFLSSLDKFIDKLDAVPGVLGLILTPLRDIMRVFRFVITNGAKFLQFTTGKIGNMLGFGDDQAEAQSAAPSVRLPPTPQDRSFRFFTENNQVNKTEVTLRDETNRAQVTGGSLGNGFDMISSGAFQ